LLLNTTVNIVYIFSSTKIQVQVIKTFYVNANWNKNFYITVKYRTEYMWITILHNKTNSENIHTKHTTVYVKHKITYILLQKDWGKHDHNRMSWRTNQTQYLDFYSVEKNNLCMTIILIINFHSYLPLIKSLSLVYLMTITFYTCHLCFPKFQQN
jgi:hypothetical protein